MSYDAFCARLKRLLEKLAESAGELVSDTGLGKPTRNLVSIVFEECDNFLGCLFVDSNFFSKSCD